MIVVSASVKTLLLGEAVFICQYLTMRWSND
jgi:hypothetical protein